MKIKFLRFGLVAAASLLSLMTKAQVPTSSFSVNHSDVCIGAPVQLTDLSSDTPTSWEYVADSQTLTSQNPSFSFSTAGIHSITLVASNGSGTGTAFTETVLVNPLPALSIIAAAAPTVCTGDMVSLTCSGASTYTWTGGVTNGVSFSASSSNVYSVTAEDANGCSDVGTFSLNVSPLPALTISSPTAVCIGSAVSLTVSGGDSYIWDNSSTSDILTDSPVANTSYTATGFSAVTGCSNTVVRSIVVNALPVVSVNGGAICLGKSFTITPSGATTYTYSNGAVVTPGVDETYTVSGTDANGCVSTDAVLTVTVNSLPVISVNNGAICSGETFTITPSGALTYSYSNGSNVVAPVTTSAYSVYGVDGNGCESAAVISNVTVNPLPSISSTGGSICAGDNFTINASGANTYTYSSGLTVVSPVSTSNYTVSGTDIKGCSNYTTITVTVNQLPVITVNSGSICAGKNFTLTPSGASTYTYSSGSNIIAPTTNTVYYVSGTSAAGCVSSVDAVSNVTVNSLPVISVNSGSICAGKNFTITASGAQTYTYTGGTNIVAPSTTTLYSVSGTDANGCVSAAAAVCNVTVNALPVVSVNNGTICLGENFTITASGATTYTYAGGNTVVAPTTNTTYAVSGTDANGCISTAVNSSVTVHALPVISVNSGAVCQGESFTITASGASTYTYSGGTNVVAPATTTLYTVSGTDANGCVSAATATSNVTVNSLPVITLNSGAICVGGSFTLTPSGATTYTYSSGSNVVSPAATTVFAVMGTDANGCISAVPAISNVTVNALPVVSITGSTFAICVGQSLTLNANGASTYSWSNNSTANSVNLNPTATTTIALIGTDANGCKGTANKTITVNSLPVVTASSSTAAICAGENITIVAGGATSYSWNTGNTTANLTVSLQVTTSYTVTGTDANGCENTAAYTATVSDCTGISKQEGAINVNIFPNPNAGVFTIELQNSASAAILSADGRVVFQQELNSGSNTIELQSLPNGVYFIQLSQNNEVKNVKFVKAGL